MTDCRPCNLTAVMFWACRLANNWSSCALVDMLLCTRRYEQSETSLSLSSVKVHMRPGVQRCGRSSQCATLSQHAREQLLRGH